MTISFPAPSAAVVAEARSGRRISAARSWMKEARVVLQNGCEVTPMMRVAYDTTQAIGAFPAFYGRGLSSRAWHWCM